MDARHVATQVLTQVLEQKIPLTECLDTGLAHLADSRDKALAQALCYGVLRWLPQLQAILKPYLRKPLKETDTDIQVLLYLGIFQQLYMRIPDHAVLDTTVNMVRVLNKDWAAGFVNAILRNFQRQKERRLSELAASESASLAHPRWILKRLQVEWPDRWLALAKANNTQAPLVLRVNQRRISRDAYLRHLQTAQITAQSIPYTECGIALDQALDVYELPGFAQGWVSVQDGSAQLVATLLDVPKQARVLDACAAPGGKTAHVLEQFDPATLIALDLDATRVQKITENLQRLGLTAEVRCANATRPKTWWDGQLFERILLDAPCSGSGIIRRHPDIKYLRQPDDVTVVSTRQLKLLEALWPLLAEHGKLLYVTCSVFAEENHLQIQKFLVRHSDAQEVPILAPWGYALPVGRQMLPQEGSPFDGFYYVCIAKKT